MTLQLMRHHEGLARSLDLPVGFDLELAKEHGRKNTDHLVVAAPAVEFAKPFEAQIPIVEDALDTARKLIGVVPRLEAIMQAQG